MSPRLFRSTLLAGALVVATIVDAQSVRAGPQDLPSETMDVAFPRQSLDRSLADLASRAGWTVQVDDGLLNGRMAPAVTGRLAPRDALRRLLAGTDLEESFDGRTVRIRVQADPAAASVDLERVTVTGTRLSTALPAAYAGGQVARGSRLGMLGNSDVFETPFSTKAYTSELILNQGARNLNDIVANDPSMRTSLAGTTIVDQFTIRGLLSAGDQFDGMANLTGYSTNTIQNFERVEITKGPSAALGGNVGAIGGTYNLVPKRATDAPVRSVTFSLEDKSLAGLHVDLGQRFGPDNALGVRFNMSTENGSLYNDNERLTVAPQLSLDYRGQAVRVLLDVGTNHYRATESVAQYTLAPGASVPRVPDPRLDPGPPWEVLKFGNAFGLLTTEWDFADRWTAYARYGRYSEAPSRRTFRLTTDVDSAGNYATTGRGSYLWRQDNDVAETGVRGEWRLGSTTHRLAINALYNRLEYHDERYFTEDSPDGPVQESIYRQSTVPDPFAAGIPDIAGADYAPTYLTGYGVADAISALDDRLKVDLVLRNVRIKSGAYDKSRASPTVAALYKLGHVVAVYANYAQALEQGETAPTDATPPVQNPGQQLTPTVSRQHEFGLKWDVGTFGLTLAYFDIEKPFALIDAARVFRAGGLQTNRGLELETFGEPLAGLRVLGGVAYIDAKQSHTDQGATDGKDAVGVPAFTANLGGEFDLAAVRGLTLTTRLIYTGRAFVDLANTQPVSSWTRIDAGVRYSTDIGHRELVLRAGLDNLFDRAYWTVSGRSNIQVAPPRVWRFAATMEF